MPSSHTTQKTTRRFRALAVAGATACALAAATAPAQAAATPNCTGADAVPGTASDQALVRTTLCLINAERTTRGIPALRLNARLSQAAVGHSSDMVTHHYFSHTTPSGRTFVDRIRRAGYLGRARSWTIGENIDWGTEHFSTPSGALYSWMHSPPHRANVLRRSFREIGIGIVPDGPRIHGVPVATYTTDFGAKF
jgi:uncharacterized protein YkwD